MNDQEAVTTPALQFIEAVDRLLDRRGWHYRYSGTWAPSFLWIYPPSDSDEEDPTCVVVTVAQVIYVMGPWRSAQSWRQYHSPESLSEDLDEIESWRS